MHVSPINLYGITQGKKSSQVLHLYFVLSVNFHLLNIYYIKHVFDTCGHFPI